jgi:hypothetical protein
MKKRIAAALALIVLIGGLAQAGPNGTVVFSNGGTVIIKDPPPPPPVSSVNCRAKGC